MIRWMLLMAGMFLWTYAGKLLNQGQALNEVVVPVFSCPFNLDQIVETSCYYLSHLPSLFGRFGPEFPQRNLIYGAVFLLTLFLGLIYERDSYYLATKFYAMSGKKIQDVFEEQLKRCRTDYFDFYLLHGMDENSFDKYTDKQNDYLGYLLKQKENGRIRNLGFFSHAAPETLKRFLEWHSGFDMALIQLNYLDWIMLEAKRQYEMAPQCSDSIKWYVLAGAIAG